MLDSLPEVVISKSVSIANSVTAVTTKEYFNDKAVAYLREDLLKFGEETNIDENSHWPPTFEVLNARKPPEWITFTSSLVCWNNISSWDDSRVFFSLIQILQKQRHANSLTIMQTSQQGVPTSILEIVPKFFPQLEKTFKILHE